jgi:hypothetical protein
LFPWPYMHFFSARLRLAGVFFSSLSSSPSAVRFHTIFSLSPKQSDFHHIYEHLLPEDDHIATSSVYGYLMLTTGIGNILSTPIATSLQRSSHVLHGSRGLGFDVNDGRYASMIIFTGVCFATAAASSCAGWWNKNNRS